MGVDPFPRARSQGRTEFRTLELVFGWPGIGVMFVIALAAAAFTIAMRSPLSRGFRWGPAVWGVAVFLLTFHANLYWWWAEWGLLQREWLDPVTTLFGLDRLTFLDDASIRWVLAALGGVGLGAAIGRPVAAVRATARSQPNRSG